MVKHTLSAVGLGLFMFLLYVLQYTGAFKSVTIGVDQRGPYTILFKPHVGAYHKIVSVIEEVETYAKKNGLKCRLSFGEYFDNPAIVEEGRLQSRGGCLIDPLEKSDGEAFEKIKDSLPEEFKYDVIPESKAVVALFTGAPGIGPMKVYPKADEFIQNGKLKKKGPALEIYEIFDNKSMQTIYIWPIEN